MFRQLQISTKLSLHQTAQKQDPEKPTVGGSADQQLLVYDLTPPACSLLQKRMNEDIIFCR